MSKTIPVREHSMPDDSVNSVRDAITLESLDHDPYPLLAALQAERSVMWMPALNMWFVTHRDPDYFTDPHVFDIRRPNASDHLSFGSGAHYCLGAALARGEITQLITHLMRRFPHLAMTDPDACAPRGFEFRSPPRLEVALGSSPRVSS